MIYIIIMSWFNFLSKEMLLLTLWANLITTKNFVKKNIVMGLLVVGRLAYCCLAWVVEMVFCCQNCSDLLWERNRSSDQEIFLKFEAYCWEFSNFLRSLEQSDLISTNNYNSNLKKKLGCRNMQEKLENAISMHF